MSTSKKINKIENPQPKTLKLIGMTVAPLLVFYIISFITYFAALALTIIFATDQVLESASPVNLYIWHFLFYLGSLIVFPYWYLRLAIKDQDEFERMSASAAAFGSTKIKKNISTPRISALGKESIAKDDTKNKAQKNTRLKPLAIILGLILLGAILQVLVTSAIALLSNAFPGVFSSYIGNIQATSGNHGILNMLTVILLGPVAEEFIFRGLSFTYAKKAAQKSLPAIFISAILFAIFHGNLIQGIYAFLIGLLLAWLVEKTDTLLPSIILHIAINGSAFLYPIIFSGVKKTALNYWIMFGLSLAICVISFFLYIAGKKKILPHTM